MEVCGIIVVVEISVENEIFGKIDINDNISDDL